MAVHHNGAATSGSIGSNPLASVPSRLDGPGFSLTFTAAGTTLSFDVAVGHPSPEQVLRLLRHQKLLLPTNSGQRLTVDITTTGGGDRYVFSADLTHRLLFSRRWNRHGHTGVFYGFNPIVGDTDGPVTQTPARASLRNMVGVLEKSGPLARIDVLNIFTMRTASASELPRSSVRVVDQDFERSILRAARWIVPAWGGAVRDEHMPAVQELLRQLVALDAATVLRAGSGRILTTSRKPVQPSHARIGGYSDLELVPAPAAWLQGGTLAGPSTPTRNPIPPQDRRPATSPSIGSDVPWNHQAPSAQPSPRGDWRTRKPGDLMGELTKAGMPLPEANRVAGQLHRWSQEQRFTPASGALSRLLRGDLPLLLEAGTVEATLMEVLPRLIGAASSSTQVARSLVAGSVLSGGVGVWPAFRDIVDREGSAPHLDGQGRFPVPGIRSPKAARLAYARLTGYAGSDDRVGTAARGNAAALRAQHTDPPTRFGWEAANDVGTSKHAF